MDFHLETANFKRMVLEASYTEISQRRRELLGAIDGDAFYCISCWPNEMQRIFWKKPINDEETFILTLFLVGNGCSPYLASQWVLTSTYWEKNKTNKRSEQIQWIVGNIVVKERYWFYFDLYYNRYLYLNGDERVLH